MPSSKSLRKRKGALAFYYHFFGSRFGLHVDLDGKLFIDYLSPLKRRMVTRKLEKQRKIDAQKLPRVIL